MTKDEALKLALEALENSEYGDYDKEELNKAINAIKEALVQTEFIKHEVENADDWSEWVCPDHKGYLMKCCDCGLVHEAEFRIVRYKSETEREDCDIVDDPNLQAVFRMRRSEQWLPEDTAQRAGGLPMAQPEQDTIQRLSALVRAQQITIDKLEAQPEQEPMAMKFKIYKPTVPDPTRQDINNALLPWVYDQDRSSGFDASMWVTPVSTLPPQRTWVGLTDEEMLEAIKPLYANPFLAHNALEVSRDEYQAIEAKLKEKNNG